MGEVYLAHDERLERPVAVKLLPGDRSLDPDARGRMMREARAASALRHPNIVTVYDVGEHEGRAYIAMEYVEGETFDELLRRRHHLPAAEAVALIAQAAEALAAAHAAGVLHRDVKSANLIVDEAGRVKMLDFGLSKRTESARGSQPPRTPTPLKIPPPEDDDAVADTALPDSATWSEEPITTPAKNIPRGILPPVPRPLEPLRDSDLERATAGTAPAESPGSSRDDEPMTLHGSRMGTPGWAAPELIDGRIADVRTDVFSLAVVLYQLLTGKMPFPSGTWNALRAEIARGPAPPSSVEPTVPAALDPILVSALAADPDRRPDSPLALVAACRVALAPTRARRHPLVAGVLGAGVVGTAVVLVLARPAGSPRATGADAAVGPSKRLPAAPAPTLITHLFGCAYSPAFVDEDTVVFDLTRDGNVDLYRLDLAQPEPKRLTRDPGWEWRAARGASPDEIIFISQENERFSRVGRMDLDTGELGALVDGVSGPAVFAGDAYYYAPGRGSAIRRRRGARDEIFLSTGERPSYTLTASHDGTLLAAMLYDPGIVPRVCTTSIAQPELSCSDVALTQARPAFSAASDALYVDTEAGIARIALDGARPGAATTFALGVRSEGGIAVSPSGATMVFSDCGSKESLIDVVDDVKRPVIDDDHALRPAFGPDKRLAYVHGAGDGGALMVRDPKGVTSELLRVRGRITDIAFAEDGNHLAYAVADLTTPGIYVTALTNPAASNRVTEDPGDTAPAILAETIYFTRTGADGVPHAMRVALFGGTPEPLLTRPRRVLDVDVRTKRVLLSAPGNDYLYWWDPATGRETPGPALRAGEPFIDVAVSPDGRWVLFVIGGTGQVIRRLRLDGKSQIEDVTTLSGDTNSVSGAIDNRGHPLIAVSRWAGELWRIDAPEGTKW